MFQDVIFLLQRFGLKDTDARIFLLLSHFKDGLAVHEIVRQTHMKRSSVDLILKRLAAGGYVRQVKVGKRFRFFAEAPEAILFNKEQAVGDFRQLLPFLAKLGADKSETEISFFEGAAGIRKIFDDILMKFSAADPPGDLLSFSSALHFTKIFPDVEKAFIRKRVALGAGYKAIAPQSSGKIKEWNNDPAALRQVKYIDDKKFPIKVTFDIYVDSISIYSLTKPIGGVVIRNKRIADSMRVLFYLVWGMLPEE